jgi:hypothetical protein
MKQSRLKGGHLKNDIGWFVKVIVGVGAKLTKHVSAAAVFFEWSSDDSSLPQGSTHRSSSIAAQLQAFLIVDTMGHSLFKLRSWLAWGKRLG